MLWYDGSVLEVPVAGFQKFKDPVFPCPMFCLSRVSLIFASHKLQRESYSLRRLESLMVNERE
jgi:hypothetical protein